MRTAFTLLAAAIALAAAAGGAVTPAARADDPVRAPAAVLAARVEPISTGVRLSIDVAAPAEPRRFFLRGEAPRFVVDFPDAQMRLSSEVAAAAARAAPETVRALRFAQRDSGVARLVLDLAADGALVGERSARIAGGGMRYVFEVSAQATPPRRPPAELTMATPAPTPARTPRAGRPVIVIDAGHGGRDPGAISVNGLQEKEVTLDSALRLRAILERTGRYHVALTRDADAFVELADRVAFARAQGADLFVSLHADAHDNHEAHGASIYTLSEQGSARAQRLMGRQNWQIDLGDAPREGVVGAILVDLAQRDTTNRSAVFAQQVIERFTGVTPLLRNTHRNAGFFVLLAPDVPAVLIEMGFLTNASDEQRLSTPAHRERLMRALATAIDAHFSEPQIVLAAR